MELGHWGVIFNWHGGFFGVRKMSKIDCSVDCTNLWIYICERTVKLLCLPNWKKIYQLLISMENQTHGSVKFSCSVMSDCLWPHGLQYTMLPCPSPTSRTCSNSCPLSQWCHASISSSVFLYSCLQSLPHQGLFKWVSSLHQVAKVLQFQL